MAYNRTVWENREVENPRTYVIETNSDGTVTLVPAEGTVIEAGTPISADPLNNIEDGILSLEAALSEVNANYIRQPGYAPTGGTGAAYSASLIPGPTGYYEGFGITIIPHVTNTTNTTTLNVNGLGAVALKDQRGNAYAAGRLLAGKPYSFRKVGSDFLADSAGGNGTALPAHVLAPYSFTNDNGEFTGTMPHITSAADPALGVGQWSNGDLAVYPKEGYRKGGAGAGELRVTTAQLQSAEPQLTPSVILEGNNIYGVNGSILNLSSRNHHYPAINYTVWVGDRIFLMPPAGWFNGQSWLTYPAPSLVASNIRLNANVLGVVGTLREYYGGSFSVNFNSPGSGGVGGHYEIFRINAGWTNISFSGRMTQYQSSTNIYQKQSLILQDIHGNELTLSGIEYSSSSYNMFGLYIDRVNRQITTVGTPQEENAATGGWPGQTDIGVNGTFSKPFNMDNRVILYFKIEASMGGGFTACSAKGKVAYN
ncbi:hypothetical protein J7E73_02255 [Paenibacillus albidus]|uniref:hypothetical protein n=1 Tax=Paenibacillus albidus TaxID=2041023 RepID=UPI001BEB67F8|nr:hypothetical protein [Paenibacillus albidus]MBT2287968.1 hypothetical protein [Paenibacillus albidus]